MGRQTYGVRNERPSRFPGPARWSVPNTDTGGEIGGPSRRRLERGEARAARLGHGGAGEPLRDPHQVDRGGRDHVLEVRLGQPDVAAPSQAAAADGLGVRALDAGAGGVAGPERLGLLVPARALQCLEVLARL